MYGYFIIDIHSPTYTREHYEWIYLRMRKQDGGGSEMVGIYIYTFTYIIHFYVYDQEKEREVIQMFVQVAPTQIQNPLPAN